MKLNRRNFLQLLIQATAGVLVAPKPKVFDLGKAVVKLREPKIMIAADPAILVDSRSYLRSAICCVRKGKFFTIITAEGVTRRYVKIPPDKWKMVFEYPSGICDRWMKKHGPIIVSARWHEELGL